MTVKQKLQNCEPKYTFFILNVTILNVCFTVEQLRENWKNLKIFDHEIFITPQKDKFPLDK